MGSMETRMARSFNIRANKVRAAAMAHNTFGRNTQFRSVALIKAGILEEEIDNEIQEGILEYQRKKGS